MIYFSDFFRIDESKIEAYGAFNISLINDLPLFVDPFTLFGSEKVEYQQLHDEILEYITFLRDKVNEGEVPKAKLRSWYFFREVKQNWFGYSLVGNSGRGLAMQFAKDFSKTLNVLFRNLGKETLTQSSHLEKACLIKSGVGRDNISDFSTNLIKGYLLDYTEKFALENLKPFQLRKISVPKAYFNYKVERWMPKSYMLPYISGDYIILTPRDILTKDENWINRHDLDGNFDDICNSVENDELRFAIQNYFQQCIPAPDPKKKPSKKDKKAAITKVIEKFPEILDLYIKTKEEGKNEAKTLVEEDVESVESFFVKNIVKLVALLNDNNFYDFSIDLSYESIKNRIGILKNAIEEKEGFHAFYHQGNHIKREKELQLIQKLVWYASPKTPDNQQDYQENFSKIVIYRGKRDKNKFSFKLASNNKLKDYLIKHVKPQKEDDEDLEQLVVVIFYFDSYDLGIVNSLLNEINMNKNKNILLIDAGIKDNESESDTKKK